MNGAKVAIGCRERDSARERRCRLEMETSEPEDCKKKC